MILVDASMVVYRAYKKLDHLENSKGVSTGMEYGTLRILESLQKKYLAHDIILVFDGVRSTVKRKKIEPAYKANRSEKETGFIKRMSVLKDFLKRQYLWAEDNNYEADDLLYSIAKAVQNDFPEDEVFIYTNDNDLLQAVSPQIKVIKSHRSDLYIYDLQKVFGKYGVTPNHLPVFRAFIGDSSDNLTGVSRIFKKPLARIISSDHGSQVGVFDRISRKILQDPVWSINMRIKIAKFINSGQAKRNYLVMKLDGIDFTLEKATFQPIREQLEEWEIYSLKMCKDIGMEKPIKPIDQGDEF